MLPVSGDLGRFDRICGRDPACTPTETAGTPLSVAVPSGGALPLTVVQRTRGSGQTRCWGYESKHTPGPGRLRRSSGYEPREALFGGPYARQRRSWRTEDVGSLS
jgi:hypothetical protein